MSEGFVLTGTDLRDDHAWPLDRSPFLLETSMPGVFAAGDVRHGSVKRVASAVGEGSVAIQLLHRLFVADRLHPRGRPKGPRSQSDADAAARTRLFASVGARAVARLRLSAPRPGESRPVRASSGQAVPGRGDSSGRAAGRAPAPPAPPPPGAMRRDEVKKLIAVALAGLATVALPVVGAQAKPDHEKGRGKHGAKSKRCKKPRSVGFVLRGSLGSLGGRGRSRSMSRGRTGMRDAGWRPATLRSSTPLA